MGPSIYLSIALAALFIAIYLGLKSRREVNRLIQRGREMEQVVSGASCILWEGTITKRSDGTFQWNSKILSPEPRKQFGLPESENDSGAWAKRILPEDVERTTAIWQNALNSGASSYKQEYSVIDIEGNTHLMREEVKITQRSPGVYNLIGVMLDITELKKTQDELAREHNFLTALMDSMTDQIYFKDTESRFLRINPQLMRTLNVNKQSEALGKSDHDYFPRELADAFRADDMKVIESGKPLIDHVERGTTAGKDTWLSTSKAPIIDKNGKVVGLVGISRDITDRRSVELDLQRERDLLQALLDSIPDQVYCKDTQSRFMKLNLPVVKNLGAKDLDDVLGKTDFEFMDKEAAQKYFDEEQQIMKSRQPQINQLTTHWNNSEKEYSSVTKCPIVNRDGAVIGVVGICRDVTVYKRTEVMLQEIIAKSRCILWYATVTQNGEEYDWVFTMFASDSIRKWLGMTTEKKDDNDVWAQCVVPEHKKEMDRQSRNAFKSGMKGYEQEYRLKGIDGTVRWVSENVEVTPIGPNKWRLTGVVTDIHDSKTAKELLAEERRTLRTLIDNIPDTIYCKDMGGRYVTDNVSHRQMLGITNAAQVIGKTVFDFFPPEIAKAYAEDDRKVLTSGMPMLNRQEPSVDKNGSLRWLSTTKVPLRNNQGKIVGLVGISRDITDRKRVEEELMTERELLHVLMNCSPDGIYFKDTKARFTRYNDAQCGFLNVKDTKEALGKTDFDFFPTERASEYDSDEKRILETGQPLLDKIEKVVSRDGQEHWVSVSKAPTRDKEGRITGLVGISRAITGRMKVEQALREREFMLRQVLDTNPNIIFVKDRDSNIVLANSAFADFYQTTVDDLVGSSQISIHNRRGGNKDEIARWLAEDKLVIDSGQARMVLEPATRGDGKVRWYRTKKLPLTLANGMKCVLVVEEDVTDLKLAEDELAKERDLLQALMDNIPDSIYFKDIESKYIRINHYQAMHIGLNHARDAIGKTDWDFYPEERARETLEDEKKILRGQRIVSKVEKQLISGKPERWTLTSKVPFYGRDGRIVGLVGVAKDITEIKQMERDLAEANEQLNELARIDSLTGLLNRRMLLELGDNEWARWQRYGKQFSLMVIDADNFKSINDKYGHLTGDQALKQIAAKVTQSVRTVDVVGRYGGEEFVVILPETTLEGALIAGDKILNNIRKASLIMNGHAIQLTVSIGTAMVTKEDKSLDAILQRADAALYTAKHNGKDQIFAAQA